ncbi:hypothetical protein DM860_006342 [Cuscuta australis]|uniref:Uncharacterized protein n=1 Tax=Cuscuta australis TaxID=267555 RepID=A0A328D376_9ASTE|nr:hypothetical protein DM860_006342 [Cuscuta australis]
MFLSYGLMIHWPPYLFLPTLEFSLSSPFEIVSASSVVLNSRTYKIKPSGFIVQTSLSVLPPNSCTQLPSIKSYGAIWILGSSEISRLREVSTTLLIHLCALFILPLLSKVRQFEFVALAKCLTSALR